MPIIGLHWRIGCTRTCGAAGFDYCSLRMMDCRDPTTSGGWSDTLFVQDTVSLIQAAQGVRQLKKLKVEMCEHVVVNY